MEPRFLPWFLIFPRYQCKRLLSVDHKTNIFGLPDALKKFAFPLLPISRHCKSNKNNNKRKPFFEKNLSLIDCSCNSQHHPWKSLGFGSVHMERPRADLWSVTLGALRVEGHLFEISCHNSALCRNGQGANKDGYGLSSSDASSDGFCRGLVGKEVIAGAQIPYASGAGLSLERRPVFPPWDQRQEQKHQ